MKLKTLLTSLLIVGIGMFGLSAQADSLGYEKGSWDGMMFAKRGDDDRQVQDDPDDGYYRGKSSFRYEKPDDKDGEEYTPPGPTGRQMNFKERLYMERWQERQEAKKAEEEAKQ